MFNSISDCRFGFWMESPEDETEKSGAEACFSEAQLKTLAGLMQATINKALDKAFKDRGQSVATGGDGGGKTPESALEENMRLGEFHYSLNLSQTGTRY